jgi:biopolymer transport protein TolQ
VFAVAFVVSVFLLAAGGSFSPAAAQLQRAAPEANGRPPAAAPTASIDAGQTIAAPPGTGDEAAAGTGVQAGELRVFTPVGLFERADIVVKCVLLLLLAASFWVWVRIIDKWLTFSSLRRKANRFEQNFWSGRPLDDLYQHYSTRADHPIAALFVAGLREWKRAFENGTPKDSAIPGVKERVEKAMTVSIQRETDKLERGLGYLATVGSTAPFVGLFGTVWGIMNSFQSIAERQDTTLSVVAPGIAEALFATALGLLAAIPAVIAYNRFVNELGRYTNRLENFADEFSAYLSRQLDERSR